MDGQVITTAAAALECGAGRLGVGLFAIGGLAISNVFGTLTHKDGPSDVGVMVLFPLPRADGQVTRGRGATHSAVVAYGLCASLAWRKRDKPMHENEISWMILNAAVEVHRTLGGPGLLEGVYEEALAWELRQAGCSLRRQFEVPIHYKGHRLATPLKLDLMVNGLVIVECKATSRYHEVFESQALTYLRLTNLRLGLVINFGERLVKDGFHRVVNGLSDT